MTYKIKLKQSNIIQSMSRKGHYLDNAPIESFLGYLNHECICKHSQPFKALQLRIAIYLLQ